MTAADLATRFVANGVNDLGSHPQDTPLNINMRSFLLGSLAATALAADCTRELLKGVSDSLISAHTAGDPTLIKPVADTVEYTENFKPATMKTGILSHAMKPDHTRSSLDTTQCATYTELIFATNPKPYVIGVQMYLKDNKVAKIEKVITTTGDWLFNATGTLSFASKESWDTIPEAKRDTREVIKAAADAYLDLFSDKTVKVPWGTPCARLEGGISTGKGLPDDSCAVGVPDGVKLTNRRYVIDETVGAVDVFLTFGSGLPDSHEFRVEGGKLRFVHTITFMNGSPGPGGKGKAKGKSPAGTGGFVKMIRGA